MSRDQRRSKLGASFFGTALPSAPGDPIHAADDPAQGSAVDPGTIDVVQGFNPRSYLSDDAFTPEALQGLVDSVREHGVIQPLAVRRENGRLKLIAGERRLHAARLAGLEKVPVVVLDVDEAQALRLAIIENAQREDVDVVSETLLGFELLSRHTRLPQGEVVAYLHAVRKGRQQDIHGVEALLRTTYGTGISLWAQRRSLVLRMTEDERAAIRARQLEVAVCAELVALPEGAPRTSLLERAIRESLSAPQLRELVAATRTPAQAPSELSARVSSLRKRLGKLSQLQGTQARQAEELIRKLEALIQD